MAFNRRSLEAQPHRIKIPTDLASISTLDRHLESPPEEVGLSAATVETIWKRVENLYRVGTHPAITLVLRRRGKVVLRRSIGHARGNGPGDYGVEPLMAMPDTPICLFSASKAISAMLVHKLVELGKLQLDDRIVDYIPEYTAGKERTTLRQLLAHRAGVPRVPHNIDPHIMYDWDLVVRLLCASRPIHEHHEIQAYHAITGGYILGEVVRRVSGLELNEALRRWIAEPLGCHHMSFGVEPKHRALAAFNSTTGPRLKFPFAQVARNILGTTFEDIAALSNEEAFWSAVIPAGNIYASADDACRFFQMMLDGGEFEGRRVFKPETIAEAVRPYDQIRFDRTLFLPIRFSTGMMLGEKGVGLFGPHCPKAFGHIGFMNVVCWADPDRDISVALLNTGKNLSPRTLLSVAGVIGAIGSNIPRDGRRRATGSNSSPNANEKVTPISRRAICK
jgi:CubicO group peptidase (beta-lactamase class C family)